MSTTCRLFEFLVANSKTAGRCSNNYWLQLCSQIQIAADTDNIKGMYDAIKQAFGPIQKKSLLKSATGMIMQDRAQQMERWVKHYSELDLTKALNLVSRDGLFKILLKFGCPPHLLNIIRSFHEGMKGTVVFDVSPSYSFDI